MLHYAFDLQALYLRLDPAESPARAAEVADRLRVSVLGDGKQATVTFPLAPGGGIRTGARADVAVGRVAFDAVMELELPFAAVGLVPGERVALSLHVLRGDVEVERLPRYGYVAFTVPDPDFERIHWTV
jgi:hypothetical protein